MCGARVVYYCCYYFKKCTYRAQEEEETAAFEREYWIAAYSSGRGYHITWHHNDNQCV
jgi:hypothetical protein